MENTMSGTNNGGGSPPEGVVRNSALSFVALAQPVSPETSPNQNTIKEQINQTDRLMPAGLKALCDACSRLYPDQPNPLQVTTRLKYWLGGHDPLDYISMYWNPGKPDENVPPHWHYISFGLSDLHGDGRVHPPAEQRTAAGSALPSGCGLELTFRLAAECQSQPPLWPATLLQSLARYIFTTGNKFVAGDHVSWHRPLDGGTESRMRHLLVTQDPQLEPQETPHGTVTFLQMVGCTGKELRSAQRTSGFEVLRLISEDPKCGGRWLVTRMDRRACARRVRTAAFGTPAHLAGVTCKVRWRRYSDSETDSPAELTPGAEQQIKAALQRGLTTLTMDPPPEGHMSTESFEMSSIEKALPVISDVLQDSWSEGDSMQFLDGVHIILNPEGASLLPLAISGRVCHGRHFTWASGSAGPAVSVLPPTVTGALVCPRSPYAARGHWLQVMLSSELSAQMQQKVACLQSLGGSDEESEDEDAVPPPSLPYCLSWREHRLKITVLPDELIL